MIFFAPIRPKSALNNFSFFKFTQLSYFCFIFSYDLARDQTFF